MDSPKERVKIAISESERLKEYLGSLPAEDWNKPSACDHWDVRDVVAHLAWTAESYAERIHQSLQEDSSTPEGQRHVPDLFDFNSGRRVGREMPRVLVEVELEYSVRPNASCDVGDKGELVGCVGLHGVRPRASG